MRDRAAEAPSAFPPSALLHNIVACYWSLSDAPREPLRLLPDGSLDLVFTFTPAGAQAMLVGVASGPQLARPPPGAQIVGVRFAPGEASSALGVAAADSRDRTVPLDEVLGAAGRELGARLGEARSTEGRVAMLDLWLRGRLGSRQPTRRPDETVRGVIRLVTRLQGRVQVRSLAQQAGLSERQLGRRFAERVGIGPKLFCRIIRLHGLLLAARRSPRPDWAQLAADCGYSDQAHLIHDFAALVGATPGSIGMADFYNL